MKNVSQDATKIANVLNFMNVEEVFVLWLKNVVQTMTVLHLNLVPLPFLSKYLPNFEFPSKNCSSIRFDTSLEWVFIDFESQILESKYLNQYHAEFWNQFSYSTCPMKILKWTNEIKCLNTLHTRSKTKFKIRFLFLVLDKENVRMFVLDLLSAVEMLFVKPVLTVLSVHVRMAILVTQKMTKLDVKRNFVPLTRIVLMR